MTDNGQCVLIQSRSKPVKKTDLLQNINDLLKAKT